MTQSKDDSVEAVDVTFPHREGGNFIMTFVETPDLDANGAAADLTQELERDGTTVLEINHVTKGVLSVGNP